MALIGYGIITLFRFHSLPKDVTQVLYGKGNVPITLYSLADIADRTLSTTNLPKLSYFYILGQTELTASEAAKAFDNTIDSIEKKDRYILSSFLTAFSPRHAITYEKSGQKYEVFLCFDTQQIRAYCNGKEINDKRNFRGKSDSLDALLKSAGIPIADPIR